MSVIRITKEFRFEAAHALKNYDGKCRYIHGHSYRLFVTIKGFTEENPDHPKSGMVIDFSDIKSIVAKHIIEPFDHALIMRRDTPLITELTEAYTNVRIVDFQPTSENIIIHFASLLKLYLPEHISLLSLKLYETPTSYAEWFAEDQ